MSLVAVRRHRGRSGRRRHRTEPRPARTRGDAGGTDAARFPRRQLPRVGPHLPLRLPDPFDVRLVVAAKAGFDELERLSDSLSPGGVGCRFITLSGALDFGPPRDPRALARVLEAAASSTNC